MAADLTFRNVTLIDGSGSAGRAADVAVEAGRIIAVGEAPAGRREVDGRGLVLCPGFVDTHSHDDGAFLRYPAMEFKLAQGVTTEISGNCGSSAIPNAPGRSFPNDIAGGSAPWEDLDGYFAACMERRQAINNAMLVGHNRVRALAMDYDVRAASAAELAGMQG